MGGLVLATWGAPADARDGCGRGWYWNGYSCVPQYAGPPPGYYGPPRGYYRGLDRPIYGEDSFGRPEVWFRPYVAPNGSLQCAQPGYTVQNGICKRYRGY
jgi:hypothetical protein